MIPALREIALAIHEATCNTDYHVVFDSRFTIGDFDAPCWKAAASVLALVESDS